ncbi:UDP-galactose/UDP-glucose transporter 5B isoform X4 [Solanum lycopersicum]|uniref:UDP-galactose/UDP-glucose transporter 5B isoform X4 n=1 Tax=Solanum lycopersicum TaxID=4081 RepID=UPI0008FEB7AF|nr:UDP-galactose/UDP-glucose transporter 5B isoform X4 [Solanum lycopersicum]
MAEPPLLPLKENKIAKGTFAVVGIMSTLVIYGILQEKIMRVPYGLNKEFFSYSLFLVFCNRITTSAVSAGVLLASKKALDPVAPLYKYGVVSVSNILTTTCQYEALKYVSFPVQTLAKCAKMIPVMIWGAIIMQKKYQGQDYLLAFLVTLGCSLFILYQGAGDISPFNRGRESTVWGVSLMIGYLGFDGFTSTFQDKLFKGYDMEIHNQIFYTTVCSCLLSFIGSNCKSIFYILHNPHIWCSNICNHNDHKTVGEHFIVMLVVWPSFELGAMHRSCYRVWIPLCKKLLEDKREGGGAIIGDG